MLLSSAKIPEIVVVYQYAPDLALQAQALLALLEGSTAKKAHSGEEPENSEVKVDDDDQT